MYMEAFPLLEQVMAYFRPGDIVQVTKEVEGNHPNFNRRLKVGDKLLVFKVNRQREKYSYSSSGSTVSLCYLTSEGEEWIDGKNARIAYKGNKDDCLKFLEKHERRPHLRKEGVHQWCSMRRHEEIQYHSYIPYHLLRHIKCENMFSNDGTTFANFKTQEEAYAAASMAWLRLTPAQQLFFLTANSLFEIFP